MCSGRTSNHSSLSAIERDSRISYGQKLADFHPTTVRDGQTLARTSTRLVDTENDRKKVWVARVGL